MSKLFPIIGQKNATSETELPKSKTSPQLKNLAGKISAPAYDLIARLGELKHDDNLTPDEKDIELFKISKQIVQLNGRELRAVLKPYKSAVIETAFPIIGDLYERN
jgi:hypothetical protein